MKIKRKKHCSHTFATITRHIESKMYFFQWKTLITFRESKTKRIIIFFSSDSVKSQYFSDLICSKSQEYIVLHEPDCANRIQLDREIRSIDVMQYVLCLLPYFVPSIPIFRTYKCLCIFGCTPLRALSHSSIKLLNWMTWTLSHLRPNINEQIYHIYTRISSRFYIE